MAGCSLASQYIGKKLPNVAAYPKLMPTILVDAIMVEPLVLVEVTAPGNVLSLACIASLLPLDTMGSTKQCLASCDFGATKKGAVLSSWW